MIAKSHSASLIVPGFQRLARSGTQYKLNPEQDYQISLPAIDRVKCYAKDVTVTAIMQVERYPGSHQQANQEGLINHDERRMNGGIDTMRILTDNIHQEKNSR